MTDREILALEKCVIDENRKRDFDVSWYYVASGNFNDQRLLKCLTIAPEDINGKSLMFFDVFDGVSAAIAACVDGKLYVIASKNGEKHVECAAGYDVILTESRADHLDACHIR